MAGNGFSRFAFEGQRRAKDGRSRYPQAVIDMQHGASAHVKPSQKNFVKTRGGSFERQLQLPAHYGLNVLSCRRAMLRQLLSFCTTRLVTQGGQ